MNDVFSERLHELMDERGFTQKDLAQRIGASVSAVGAWKRGTNYPDVRSLRKIAEALGVSLDYLCGMDSLPGAATCGSAVRVIEALLAAKQASYKLDTAPLMDIGEDGEMQIIPFDKDEEYGIDQLTITVSDSRIIRYFYEVEKAKRALSLIPDEAKEIVNGYQKEHLRQELEKLDSIPLKGDR